MYKTLAFSTALLLGATATQAQLTAVQVIQEMITHSLAPVNTVGAGKAVFINATIADNDKSYTVLDVLTKKTATTTILGRTSTYNTIATMSSSMAVTREFTAHFTNPSAMPGGGTVANCTVGTSFGWFGNPIFLGGFSITLPNGTRKSYTIPTNMTVTVLTTGSRYLLSGPLGTGQYATIYLSKGDFYIGG